MGLTSNGMLMSTDDYGAAEVIHLGDIDPQLRPASQARAAADAEAIAEYQEVLDDLPPVLLVRDKKGVLWIADGRHRITAAVNAGRTEVLARVKRGTYFDAFRAACHANLEHGVRVTNVDKVHRVAEALALPEVADWSNRLIAEFCAVTETMVRNRRADSGANETHLNGAASDPAKSKRVGKDGKKYPGSQQSKPKQADDDDPPRREPLPGQTSFVDDEPDDDDDGSPEEEEESSDDEEGSPDAGDPVTDRNLAAWGRNFNKLLKGINLLLVSIPRRGGLGNLARHASADRIRVFKTHLVALRDACTKGIAELEDIGR